MFGSNFPDPVHCSDLRPSEHPQDEREQHSDSFLSNVMPGFPNALQNQCAQIPRELLQNPSESLLRKVKSAIAINQDQHRISVYTLGHNVIKSLV